MHERTNRFKCGFSGNVRLNKPLPSVDDMAENTTYTLSITAIDGGGIMAEQPSTVFITVVGLDLFPPVFTHTLYHFEVSEGVERVQTVIGSVHAEYTPDGMIKFN